MTAPRKWTIKIDKNSYCVSEIDGIDRIFFIGYANGMRERSEELYFSQREKDKDIYLIEFDPEPYFISYSFFYGLFNETIIKMCTDFENSHTVLSKKNIILKRFLEKFNFVFNQNKALHETVKEYVNAIIEKTFDLQVGIGNYGNS